MTRHAIRHATRPDPTGARRLIPRRVLAAVVATAVIALAGSWAPPAGAAPGDGARGAVYSYDSGSGAANTTTTTTGAATGEIVGAEGTPSRAARPPVHLRHSSRFVAPRVTVGALDDASGAAFRAADNVADFSVPLKHQPGAGGNYARFAEGVDQQSAIRAALTSDAATFRVNYVNGVASDTSFRVVTDVGQIVGSNGQTSIRVVVGNDGQIWTAFPVK